ncbi:3308_t:CDS:2 [Paraglomus brasilianum]|uniref:Cytochrome c oxidase subunit 13, mitochondrial n=1 Tax=Paraglomus brasilianum TaxID=144538 RepID=A0A9N9A121_9GLOM|nr:3308_t:CDS:2 [Paraglomus brasilianum]
MVHFVRRIAFLPKARTFATAVEAGGISSLVAERQAVVEHAKATASLWKKISIYVCIPALVLSTANAYRLMKEHSKHEIHPEDVPNYSYLRIRSKPFFWGNGDHTLFHNPAVNK